ncbi:probable LRR receptor-like serine/threonine-protein kinase At5g45780 [Vigna radiata var. radiata]|uniref:Probable LRR receptor-like serine/threonine-protein kinase At5g45780 n=1 Tax=Vigna radiata var. radiata TaxID=3916 RepID=A0A3Q0FCS4_VIGRR|nr:probable LRR receptor-like serine/threonine-protein kinase At5g45780 [Vigna radiata var. radiata]
MAEDDLDNDVTLRGVQTEAPEIAESARKMLLEFIAGIFSAMVVALLYWLFRKKVIPFLKQRKTLKAGKEHKSFEHDTISLRCFDFKEVEKATANFSEDCLLGSGAFGNVYKGTFELEGTLAIKRAHFESFTSVDEFRNG